MAEIRLDGVSVAYDAVVAVRDVTLDVKQGELLTLLGASGSGKTTLLRLIAGFLEVTTGTVTIGGRPMRGIPPYRRNIGIVFQNYGLFSHMRVVDNVAFGLRMRRIARSEVMRQVAEVLALVDLVGLAGRYPRQLSGGQQQRVALARALVIKPEVLLLDEPFGALDKKLRDQMQIELKRLQRRLGITTVFVTHDQEEALRLADRVAVVDRGRIIQVADPVTIYESPANPFVAQFIGTAHLLGGTVRARNGDETTVSLDAGVACVARGKGSAASSGDRVTVGIRPEKIVLRRGAIADTNVYEATVEEVVYFGVATQYLVRLACGVSLTATLQNAPDAEDRAFAVGDNVSVRLPPEHVHLFADAAGE